MLKLKNSKRQPVSRREQKRIKAGGGISPICAGSCDYPIPGGSTFGYCKAMPNSGPFDPCYCYNDIYQVYKPDSSCNP